jgi:hypothetical protein
MMIMWMVKLTMLRHATRTRYYQDVKESVKRKNPSLTSNQLTSLIGQKWHNISEERKRQYQEKAKASCSRPKS